MFALLRAGLVAAVMVLTQIAAGAAEKAFQRSDLADSSIKLEAQIRKEAGTPGKSVAALRREADTALERRDFRSAVPLLSQIAAMAGADPTSWLRLARAIPQLPSTDGRDRAALLERATTAAYIAYQRAGSPDQEAESLSMVGRLFAERHLWRPALDALRLSLGLREVADIRATYEQLREQHGFRVLDYSVDSDASSPRVCFQFSEALPGRRVDFSPFVTVAGDDKPALSVEDKQLCVEGLKHGERYAVTLRAGLPSVVAETLTKSAEFSVYVRDRKPFVHFSGRAYVLPRSGQLGIPIVSVNTDKIAVKIFRIGDRNLINEVLGSDFQRNLDRYEADQLGQERGVKVWDGEIKTEPTLNVDVTTAFPIDQALGNLSPGLYVMLAQPGAPKTDDDDTLATQWFVVSDLGLTAYSGSDGLTVFLNALATTDPLSGVEVRLIARDNEILAVKTTDAAGVAHFDAGLTRGEGGVAPALVVASDPKGEYAFLSLKTPAFDLTDRGVAGRTNPAGPDAFVTTERGVYRTGETVQVTALLRDPKGVAMQGVPLTLVVQRPDGIEYRRAVVADQGAGGRSLSVAIVPSASTGTWRVRAFTDPKRPSVGETTFLVEDYVPDRLEFDLTAPSGQLGQHHPIEVAVDGRYLYGAAASGLELDGEVVLGPAKERPGLPGYEFGRADDPLEPDRRPLEGLPQTDAQGKAQFEVAIDKLPETSHALEAQVVVRMSEPGGRAVERSLNVPVTPTTTMIGVKPLFSGKSLGEGENAGFDVVVAAPDGTLQSRRGLHYELVKIEARYQWYRQDGRWDFEPVKLSQRVADGQLDVAADRPGRISLPVTFGRYRLEVTSGDQDGPTTSVTFDAGWYAESSADTPDALEVALDKAEYRPGDPMTVAVTARTAGKVTLAVVSDRLVTTMSTDVQAGLARIPLVVGTDWGTGAYVVATLRRRLDTQAGRMPGRGIGVQWFAIDRQARTLGFDMKLPSLIRPQSSLRIPVKIGGVAAGEEARVVLAAVDVGILNLTNYKPPMPDEYYLGQRQLGAEIRDLYGQLIDGLQGTRGSIRSGGDAGAAELSGSPPTQKPLALYSGLVTPDRDGNAEITFDIPAFAGTVRIMGIAWSRDKVGHAGGDITVRDPVVLTATLPRFLLTGDRASLRLDVDNVEGESGEYRVSATSEGPLALVEGAPHTLQLAAKQRSGLALPLSASGVGTGTINVTLTGPEGFTLARSFTLPVAPATQILTRRTVKPIAANESLTLSSDLFADLVPGTGSVAVSVGLSTALDAAALLEALDRYPFGCSEQITSKALPLLYVNDLAGPAHLALDPAIEERIKDSIERLLARQGSNGSFGLWSSGGEDVWLDAYVTDFLTRARERGFKVPDVPFRMALDRLRNYVSGIADPAKDGGRELAYALYVLARNGAAPLGDLRYLADDKIGSLASPIAKAQIAAALAMVGDARRAEQAYAAAVGALAPRPTLEVGRTDYGSALRDAAAVVTLASEGGASPATLKTAVERVEVAREISPRPSTQESAWMVLAARALASESNAISLDVGGQSHQGPLYRNFTAADLTSGVKVTNLGQANLQAVVSVSGAPLTPEPPAQKGFKIERLFYSLDGQHADPSRGKQNQRLVVVLRITEEQPQFGRVILADYLPAGFEIDNPQLVSSGDTGKLAWISDAVEPAHSEFRDDRFTAAFDRTSTDRPVFSVAYVVRAVSPGRYVLPQAYVEDMYRPDRFGRTGSGTIEIDARAGK